MLDRIKFFIHIPPSCLYQKTACLRVTSRLTEHSHGLYNDRKKVHFKGEVCVPVLPTITLFPNTVPNIYNLSGDTCAPVLPAVTRVTLFPNHSHKNCNISRDTCAPVLPAVTLLPKHSQVNLPFKWRYLCPCVTCGYQCYPVTQTQSSEFTL